MKFLLLSKIEINLKYNITLTSSKTVLFVDNAEDFEKEMRQEN